MILPGLDSSLLAFVSLLRHFFCPYNQAILYIKRIFSLFICANNNYLKPLIMDIVDKRTRSRMMAGIRGKNTKPELMIRKALFREGFRYRLHVRNLPGKPDLVLPRYNTIVFVHGCFWHRHNCHLFKWPKTRKLFWREKLTRNKKVDKLNYKKLKEEGWHILTVWECALKGKTRQPFEKVIARIMRWLVHGIKDIEIRGK